MDKLFAAQRAHLNRRLIKKAIVGFRQDDEQHWVAELKCGHRQHVRHQPPFINRPWVITQAGRTAMLGCLLACKFCEHPDSINQS